MTPENEIVYLNRYSDDPWYAGPRRGHFHSTKGYWYLVEQYELIQKKECKLPAMQRAAIVKEYELTHYKEKDNG